MSTPEAYAHPSRGLQEAVKEAAWMLGVLGAKPRSPLTARNPADETVMSGIRVAGDLGSTRGTSTDTRSQDDPRTPSAATDL
jgi:hypothetical protein